MMEKAVTSEMGATVKTNGHSIMASIQNKLRDSLNMPQGAFKHGGSENMNVTAKSRANRDGDATAKNADKRKDADGDDTDREADEGQLYIEPIPGVNTSSFLGINRDRVVATIVRITRSM